MSDMFGKDSECERRLKAQSKSYVFGDYNAREKRIRAYVEAHDPLLREWACKDCGATMRCFASMRKVQAERCEVCTKLARLRYLGNRDWEESMANSEKLWRCPDCGTGMFRGFNFPGCLLCKEDRR